jgi:hypothetical protein
MEQAGSFKGTPDLAGVCIVAIQPTSSPSHRRTNHLANLQRATGLCSSAHVCRRCIRTLGRHCGYHCGPPSLLFYASIGPGPSAKRHRIFVGIGRRHTRGGCALPSASSADLEPYVCGCFGRRRVFWAVCRASLGRLGAHWAEEAPPCLAPKLITLGLTRKSRSVVAKAPASLGCQ